MTSGDRAFAALLLGASAVSLVLAVPLALTLFPGEIQQNLHGYDGLVRACTAAVYHLGERLPPLGALVVLFASVACASAAARSVRMWLRTRALARRRRPVVVPATLLRTAASLGIGDAVRCFAHPLPLAYTAGVRRPLIWLSSSAVELLEDDELEAVLLHERAHLRRRDPLRLVIVRAIAAFLGLVPWVGTLAGRFEIAKELDADREALQHQGSAAALAGALFAMGERQVADGPAISSWSLSAARIDQLYGAPAEALLPRPPGRARLLSVATLTLALLLTFGQAARANVLPAGLIERAGFATDDPAAPHLCPIPTTGLLL